MVPVLNHVGTACAVYGNHDFGKERLREIIMLEILFLCNINYNIVFCLPSMVV